MQGSPNLDGESLNISVNPLTQRSQANSTLQNQSPSPVTDKKSKQFAGGCHPSYLGSTRDQAEKAQKALYYASLN